MLRSIIIRFFCAPALSVSTSMGRDEALWATIKDSEKMSDFEFYLSKFPKGRYSAVAELKVKQLKEEKVAVGVYPEESQALGQPKPELDPHPFVGKWGTSAKACRVSAFSLIDPDSTVSFSAANAAQYFATESIDQTVGYFCISAKIVKSPSGSKYTASCSSGGRLWPKKEGQLELEVMGERLTGLGPDGRNLNLVSCDSAS